MSGPAKCLLRRATYSLQKAILWRDRGRLAARGGDTREGALVILAGASPVLSSSDSVKHMQRFIHQGLRPRA